MMNLWKVLAMSMLSVLWPEGSWGEDSSRLLTHLRAGDQQVVVTYGTSLTEKGAWVTQMRQVLRDQFPGQVTVINSGGSGMNSHWGVENLEQRVLQKHPDTVFLEFSINDSVARFDLPVEQAQANLEQMIDRILEENPDCELILMTMTPGNAYPEGHRSYRLNIEAHYEMYRKVAEEKGFMLIDIYPQWQAIQEQNPEQFQTWIPDSIHPTATGCSEVVTPMVLKALGLDGKD
ncbi:SGNH/GDSL hydrolase family protein [Kiritimatiellota bacterium B12222]|nr:SGNH/GDSL hydrolase family protein [Kiritimatiellota bacterium B12222]